MKNFLKISEGSAPSAPGKQLVAQVNRQYASRLLSTTTYIVPDFFPTTQLLRSFTTCPVVYGSMMGEPILTIQFNAHASNNQTRYSMNNQAPGFLKKIGIWAFLPY